MGAVVFAVGLVALLGVAGANSAIAAFPDKPVRMIVAYRAGGSADASARVLSKFMEKHLGQPVVVTNRTGGGGAVAAAFVKNKKPDGYTIMMNGSITYTFLPQFTGKSKFDFDDFTHITTVTYPQGALVTQPGKPWKTLMDMIQKFKADGKSIALTTQAPTVRLMAEVISKATGVKFRIVPVKGGSAAGQQLLGGHVDLVWAGGWHVKYIHAGQMAVVASVGSDRLAYAPSIPTFEEMGLRDIYMDLTFMLSGPKGIPQPQLNVLSAAIKKAMDEREVRDLYEKKFTFRVVYRTPAETEKYIRWEHAKYAAFLKAARGGGTQ